MRQGEQPIRCTHILECREPLERPPYVPHFSDWLILMLNFDDSVCGRSTVLSLAVLARLLALERGNDDIEQRARPGSG